ncbi:MAG: hypothetical protein R3A48_05490 [Polyangiales bacterium]
MKPIHPLSFSIVLMVAQGCAVTDTSAVRAARYGEDVPQAAAEDVPAVAVDVPVVPVDVPPLPSCVSGQSWMDMNRGSRLMHPGQACVSCHVRTADEGPMLLAGTVFHHEREVDDCYGFAGNRRTSGGYVEVTDANNTVVRMPLNEAGNFYYSGLAPLQMPLHGITVVSPTGGRNSMDGEAPHGDCNGCHTREGTSTVAGADPAPGRIYLVP